MHESFDLTSIAVVALGALASGFVFTRFKLPAILGYLFAGVVLGPSGFSLIENREGVALLAELGVLMLLFIIGLELNLRAFREVWLVSLGCVAFQILASVGMMLLASLVFKWGWGTTLLIGFITALSSTAVSVTMLEETGEMKTKTGKLTISILIAQDLAFVPMTLMIRSFGGEGFAYTTIIKLILAIAFLVAIIFYLSRQERVKIPFVKRMSKNKDLFPLMGLAFCFGGASLSGLAGISAAYGAFLAGLILGNTAERHHIMKVTHPTQTTLLMVFFVSVGLLLDLDYLSAHFFKVMMLLLLVFVCKTALNVSILRVLGQDLPTAFLSSLMLAQIGEFSFVLTTIGKSVGLLDEDSLKMVISLTVLSLMFSPIWQIAIRRLQRIGGKSMRSFTSFWQTFTNLFSSEVRILQPIFGHVHAGIAALKHWILNRLSKK